MIIFLYGEDTFRSREKLTALKDKFLQDVDKDGTSTIALDGAEANIGKINEAVGASSLFARKRMIIIERVFANKSKTFASELADYLKGLAGDNDNIIIVWDEIGSDKMAKNKLFQFLSAQQFSQHFKALSDAETSQWVATTVAKQGGVIDRNTASMLVGMFGNDLWSLHNAIAVLLSQRAGLNKTAGSADAPMKIEAADVSHLTGGKLDENIFTLTDAISQRNRALALGLFERELEAGAAEVYLVHMISRQFRILLQVRQALDSGLAVGQIASHLKLHPFVVSKAAQQAQKYDLELLRRIFSRLVEIDSDTKTGRADFRTQLSLLIAKI